MKRLRHSALAAFLLLVPGACPAQTVPAAKHNEQTAPPAKTAAQTAADEDRIFRYNAAIGLMKQDRDFERAIALMRSLTEQYPQDRSYHLALGCAYTCRAAAVGDAAFRSQYLPKDQEKYKKWQAAWEAAQNDSSNPKYHQPAPLPPLLITRDDRKPFTLTLEEAEKAYFDLVAKAQAEWDALRDLSKTPEERGEALYTQGWGRRTARKYSHLMLGKGLAAKETRKLLPTEEQVIQDFTEATKESPKDARFWQSLGDALGGEEWRISDPYDYEKAIAAYRHAALLDALDLSAWYRIAEISAKKQPELSEDAINHVVRAEKENAYLYYHLAAIQFARTPYIEFHTLLWSKSDETTINRALTREQTEEKKKAALEAISMVERGNRMPTYKTPRYDPPVPLFLKTAWNFYRWDNFASWRGDASLSLSGSLIGYIETTQRQGDEKTAEQAATDIVALGYKMAGDIMLQTSLNSMTDLGTLEDGAFAFSEGYRLLESIYKKSGETEDARRVKAEWVNSHKLYYALATSYLATSGDSYESAPSDE